MKIYSTQFNRIGISQILAKFSISALALLSVSLYALKEKPYGKIDLTTTASGSYDSNIFSSSEEIEDFVFKLSPSVSYTKKLWIFVVGGTLGVNATKYFENSGQDQIDPISSFNFDIDDLSEGGKKRFGGKLKFETKFDVGQNTSTSVLEQDITTTTFYTAGMDVRYDYSVKSGLGSNIEYSIKDAAGNKAYADYAQWSIGGRAFYIYSKKLDFFADYTWTPTEARGGTSTTFINSATHAYSIGADGTITPKLNGTVQIGYTTKTFDASTVSSDGDFTASTNLIWKISQKRRLTLSLSRDFSVSPQDQSIFTSSGSLSLNQRFSKKLSGDAGLNYSKSEYTGTESRETYSYGFDTNLSSKINKHTAVNLNYNFSRTDEKGLSTDYDRHLTTVDLNIKY